MPHIRTPLRGEADGAQPLSHGMIAALPIAGIYPALATQPSGLTQTEAAARLQRYGPNTIREVKGRPLVLRFLANFTHVMALLLWVGGLVAIRMVQSF